MPELSFTATHVLAVQRQDMQTQQSLMQPSEEPSIASQPVVDTPHSPANCSVQLSTTEDLPTRRPPGLLNIPRELRDEVLNYILVQDRSVSLYHDHDFIYDSVKQPYLALSSTNKQLRDEAVDMFFKKNKFMWSIMRPLGSIPGHHLRQMMQIDFHSSPHRCCMRIYFKEAELELYWYGQEWKVSSHGGDVKIHSSQASSWFGQRPYRVLMEFQSLIAQGLGMNMEALKFIGRELRGCGLTR